MADLIAVVFPSEEKAEEVRNKLLGMQKDYLIDIGDAVIATKTDDGKVKLNQLMNTTAAGAAGGSFWGLLVGVLFLNPLLGVAAGAASGALAGALTDVGVNDRFMKGLATDGPEARRGGALRAGPQGDRRQGAGRAQGRRRPGAADLARPHPRGGAAQGAGRRRPAAAAAGLDAAGRAWHSLRRGERLRQRRGEGVEVGRRGRR